jgi:oxygen-dependent protoporphyrinogen oxidase
MPEGVTMLAPAKLLPFLKSNLISWPGKLRIGLEALIPSSAGDEDESLAGFVRRRFGQEALDKIAGPLFAGIHAGDPEQLSLRSTFPLFAEMERSHGSLIRAMIARQTRRKSPALTGGADASPGLRSRFLSLRGGMQSLVDAIVAQLPSSAILSGERAVSVAHQRHGQQFEITLQNGRRLIADQVLFATPAYVTADLVEGLDSTLAERLRAIRYASTATVSLGFRTGDFPMRLNGNGFIVSHRENRKITACTWSSSKFSHRAPPGAVLLRVFLGSARIPGLAELPDGELIRIALQELKTTMQVSAAPILARAYRWPRAIPQYEVGHAGRVREIERLMASHPDLHLAGAAYYGSGIPDCVQSGSEKAIKILERLADDKAEASLCAASRENT